jgi:hypothetical protein
MDRNTDKDSSTETEKDRGSREEDDLSE